MRSTQVPLQTRFASENKEDKQTCCSPQTRAGNVCVFLSIAVPPDQNISGVYTIRFPAILGGLGLMILRHMFKHMLIGTCADIEASFILHNEINTIAIANIVFYSHFVFFQQIDRTKLTLWLESMPIEAI